MKKHISHRIVTLGAALVLSAFAAFPAFAISHMGHLDTVSDKAITGWAWDSASPNTAVSVELTVSGESLGQAGSKTFTVSADQTRSDLETALGSAAHGFTYEIDWTPFETGTYTVTAAAVSGETKTPLIGTHTYTHTYKKEEAPITAEATAAAVTAPPAPEAEAPKPAAPEETKTPIGPGSGTVAVKETPAGPGSTTTTKPAGPGQGPGSSSTKSGTKKYTSKPVGPGAPSYETGEPDEFLGVFEATAYCDCDYCSGGYKKTYAGTIPQPNHTIAADLDLFPLGTKLLIDGIVYTVEDKGSNVVDEHVDIFFATHEEAYAFGRKNVKVYSVK